MIIQVTAIVVLAICAINGSSTQFPITALAFDYYKYHNGSFNAVNVLLYPSPDNSTVYLKPELSFPFPYQGTGKDFLAQIQKHFNVAYAVTENSKLQSKQIENFNVDELNTWLYRANIRYNQARIPYTVTAKGTVLDLKPKTLQMTPGEFKCLVHEIGWLKERIQSKGELLREIVIFFQTCHPDIVLVDYSKLINYNNFPDDVFQLRKILADQELRLQELTFKMAFCYCQLGKCLKTFCAQCKDGKAMQQCTEYLELVPETPFKPVSNKVYIKISSFCSFKFEHAIKLPK